MATLAARVRDPLPRAAWWEFLKEEFAPYPGRLGTVARMVIATGLVMTICMTFRIPYAFQGAVYALLISRESTRATVESAGTILAVTFIGAAYILISVRFVISFPILHFFWNLSSFFLAFYALSAIIKYAAASTFAIMISVGVPLWDRHLSAETNVEDSLWLTLSAAIGVIVTAVIELAWARLRHGDNIGLAIAERLTAMESLFACYAEGCSVDPAAKKTVIRLAMVGTSALRRVVSRSDYSAEYSARISGVVALVGRLVDLTATLTQLNFELSTAGRTRFRNLTATVAGIRADLLARRIPRPIPVHPSDDVSAEIPMLPEIENTLALIPQTFAGAQSNEDYLPDVSDPRQAKLIAPDALSNPAHLKFALKGCLAAGVCYIIYNALDWPGISTAVTTCLLTALSTIGASRQKQVLRLTGAIAGGVLIGMGSQIFILPFLDSIGGFLVLFVLVTGASAWIMTASTRLSYFGLQAAFTFYLINLQEFAMQTSLTIARDRVIGVLLGLFMMWLVFDQIWGAPAGVEMTKAFTSSLRLLAQLAREPISGELPAAVKRAYSLRDAINAKFDQVRSLADAVLFEFGPSRQRDLAVRDRVRRWQPQLRTLFLMRIASLKYRLNLPGFELPEAVVLSQRAYDDRSAGMLENMADEIEGVAPQVEHTSAVSAEILEQTIHACSTGDAQRFPARRLQSFVTLIRRIDGLTASLASEIAAEHPRETGVNS